MITLFYIKFIDTITQILKINIMFNLSKLDNYYNWQLNIFVYKKTINIWS